MMKESDFIKRLTYLSLPADQMVTEPKTCSGWTRVSHPFYSRKIPKGIQYEGFDADGRRIEIRDENGQHEMVAIGKYFGEAIQNARWIEMNIGSGSHDLILTGIEVYKVKRTYFWKLIFVEDELPF